MTERPIPKGVSPETLRDIVAGWAAVGADDAPRYTSDVEEATGISDAVGRQTRFLEALGVLERQGQRHELTDEGAALARALDAGETDRAREEARQLLSDWDVTTDVTRLLYGNPLGRDRLVRHLAALVDQDRDESRVSSGLGTLLDLYEWTGVLERDDAGRYRLPPEAAGVATDLVELRHELDETRAELSADIERMRDALESTVEASHDETRTSIARTRIALERAIAAADENTEESIERAARTLVQAIATAESGVEGALERPRSDAESEPAVEIRSGSDGEAEIVVDADAGNVEIGLDGGSTVEFAAESPDRESEPMPDGGSTVDLTADGENVTLDLDAERGVEVQAGEGPGVVVEAGDEPVEIDIDGGPTIELSAGDGIEGGVAEGTEDAEEGAEAADEAEKATEGEKAAAEETAEPAEEGVEEVTEAVEEEVEEATETAEEEVEETAETVEEEVEETAETAEEEVEETAEPAEEEAAEATETAEEGVEETAETAEEEVEEVTEKIADTAAEAVEGSEEGTEAAARSGPSTGRPGEDAVALSLDLTLDADSEQLEDLVRSLRRALIDEMLADEAS